MRKFGIWFNVKFIKGVSLNQFKEAHRNLGLTESQLSEVYSEVKPPKNKEEKEEKK